MSASDPSQLQPSVAEYLRQGQDLAQQQKIDEAKIVYQQALQTYPDDARLYAALGELQERSGDQEGSLASYFRAVSLDPKQPAATYLTLANLLMEREQYLETIALCQQALSRYPKHASLYRSLGVAQSKQGNAEAAAVSYQQAIALNPNQPVFLYLSLGHFLQETQQVEAAFQLYQQGIQLHPQCAGLYRALGVVQGQKGDPVGQIASYRQALALDDKPIWTYLSLGELLKEAENWAEAIAVYRQGLDRHGDNHQLYRALAVVQAAQGAVEDAIASYRQALALQPQSPIWVYLTLGQLLEDQDQLDAALTLYQEASQHHGDNPKIYAALCAVLQKQGRTEEAIATYRKTIALEPDGPVWIYLTLGQFLKEQQQFSEAVEVYRQAIAYHPESVEAHRALGVALKETGETEQAIAIYRTALELEPKSPMWVYHDLGQLLEAAEQVEEAIAVYETALRFNAGNVETYRLLGNAQRILGRIESVIENYRQSLTAESDHPLWLYLTLGQLLTEQDQIQDAVATYQQALHYYPDSPEVYRLLGSSLDRAGDMNGAIASYQQAIALDAKSPGWVYLTLGRLLSEANRTDEAIALYQQVMQLFPDNTEVYRLLANVYRSTGDTEAEMDCYRQLIASNADQPSWVYTALAYLLSQQGNLEAAIQIYQKAVERQPNPLNPYFLRQIDHHLQQGDLQQVVIAYQQALSLSEEWVAAGTDSPRRVLAVDTVPRVCVVTPVFNGAEFIDEAIYSVITQPGDFVIRYHVQDACSTDGTLEKLQNWQTRLQDGTVPILCRGIEFSFSSAPDRSMYDAINQAVAAVDLRENDIMTWLNADDRLASSALTTVVSVFTAFDQVHWVGGRIALIDDQGIATYLSPPLPYSRYALQSGLHDGRKLPFIQQEGTFWRGWLWQTVDGVNADLRLAGDYDLWQRFAQHTGFVLLDSILANHRARVGQLSGEMDRYYREVDQVIADRLAPSYETVWQEFAACDSPELKEKFSGQILQYDRRLKSWHYAKFPYSDHLSPPVVVSATGQRAAINPHFQQGFGPAEAANPVKHLPAGIRWTNERINQLEFVVTQAGHYEIMVVCQVFQEVLVRLTQNGTSILLAEPPVTNHDRVCKLVATAYFTAGRNPIELQVSLRRSNRMARLLVVACDAMLLEPTRSAALATIGS